ncbi:hypothetical protein AVEN_136433-1 [Araneus ventricosus]|uniref:Uncharacterized protein n=1 Tax=Araneus ventricosus TaxID=182803 RepID=A0A4Y2LBG4_ARAVE|nr:hypothetical protein AVEN_136433-1 [Araneus ventricosus]
MESEMATFPQHSLLSAEDPLSMWAFCELNFFSLVNYLTSVEKRTNGDGVPAQESSSSSGSSRKSRGISHISLGVSWKRDVNINNLTYSTVQLDRKFSNLLPTLQIFQNDKCHNNVLSKLITEIQKYL